MLDISKLHIPQRAVPPSYTWTSKDGTKVQTYTMAQVEYIFGSDVAYKLLRGWAETHTTMNGGTLTIKQNEVQQDEAPEDTPLALDAE